MQAYAFLAEGAVAPLSGYRWPTSKDGERGAWIDADAAPSEVLRGCLAGDLPYWLDDELWTIELEGKLARRDHLFLAERARLHGRIETWVEPVAWRFITACARRVARRAATALREEGRAEAAASLEEAGDLEELELAAAAAADHPGRASTFAGYASDVCFYARDAGVAARGACVSAKMAAFALGGDVEEAGHAERLAKERAWQAVWLVDQLGL